MRLLDLTSEPAIPAMTELLRTLTRVETSRDAITQFVAHSTRVRPIDHLMSVVEAPEANQQPRGFRVIHTSPTDALRAGTGSIPERPAPQAIARLPILRGGFLSRMIQEPMPKFALDLNLSDDPVLGDRALGDLHDMRSCMVLPIFNGPSIVEWTFGFSRANSGFLPMHIAAGMMNVNLLSLANRNLDTLAEVRRLHEQVNTQLEQISQLQQLLLPREMPDIGGLEVSTSYLTSDQAGGDYYDFKPLPDGRWACIIADVSGHGAAAATVMAMLRTVVHTYDDPEFQQGAVFLNDPGRFIRFINRQLVGAGIDGSFVTAFFLVYDPYTGEIVCCSAGHPPARVRRADGTTIPLDCAGGVPLGMFDPYVVNISRHRLAIGETLVLYTDGITESFNEEREMFGEARLDEAISRSNGSPDAVVESIHNSLFHHRNASTRDDDQTLLVLRHHGLCRVPMPPA